MTRAKRHGAPGIHGKKASSGLITGGCGARPASAHPSPDIENLKPGDHLCCIYETNEELLAVLTLFLRSGLERNEKILYVADSRGAEATRAHLRDIGVDVESCLSRGQLVILTSGEAYLRQGVFDPDAMIAMLRAETERALADGYSALRVTGEMT